MQPLVYAEVGKIEEALADLSRAIALNPAYRQAYAPSWAQGRAPGSRGGLHDEILALVMARANCAPSVVETRLARPVDRVQGATHIAAPPKSLERF
jgi:hypothetical protein